MCEKCDLVCLQEHWLLPNELSFLSSIHPNFLSVGYSAVDITSDTLVGRPYGGTGILYKKSLSHNITYISTNNSRLTAIILKTKLGPTLVVCVYVPTDYGNANCLEDYTEVCSL